MRLTIAALILLCVAAPALAAGEGGAGYGQLFAPGAVLDDGGTANPLATVSYVEITDEDIAAVGATNVAEVLAFAGGAFTYYADRWPSRGERLARVRGAGPEALRVYLDGVPLDDGLFGTVDLSTIPADQIARIRVYPGPAPAIFGAGGGAGVIEIVTRAPGEYVTAGFDGRFGDHRRSLFSLGLGGTYRGFQTFGMADHYTGSGEPLPDDFGVHDNERGRLREGTAFRRDHYRVRLGAVTTLVQSHLSFFYDVEDRDVPWRTDGTVTQFYRLPQVKRLGGSINTRLGAFGPFHLDNEIYLLEFTQVREDYADALYTTLLAENHQHTVRSGFGLTPWLDFGSASRVALRLAGWHDETEFFVQDQHHTRFFIQNGEVAVTDDANPVSWLNLSAGGGAAALDAIRSDTLPTPDSAVDWFARAGAAAGPFAGFTARVAAGRYPSLPTVEQWFDAQVGNPELDPATTSDIETAAAWSPLEGTRVEAIGFYRRLEDGYSIAAPIGDTTQVYQNDEQVTTWGSTASFVTRPFAGFYLGGSGTYLWFNDRVADTGVRPRFVPKYSGSGEVRYRSPLGLGGALNIFAAGKRVDRVGDVNVEMNPYSVTGARVFYNYRDYLEVYVYGYNLFDVTYETKRRYPEPGRVVTAGLKLLYQ